MVAERGSGLGAQVVGPVVLVPVIVSVLLLVNVQVLLIMARVNFFQIPRGKRSEFIGSGRGKRVSVGMVF